ncbi:hypothetical protein ACN6KG_12830 [Enterococcus faecium]|nr:hypothetical protein [Enterococcus faecium]MCC9085010.1 hypothetical protein [Enterococcus faecium]
MDASEVVNKINSLKEVFGDVEVVINAQGYDNGFLSRLPTLAFSKEWKTKMETLSMK